MPLVHPGNSAFESGMNSDKSLKNRGTLHPGACFFGGLGLMCVLGFVIHVIMTAALRFLS
jgi:hypothetical protein